MEWGEKKTICNKFIQSSEITCMVWPEGQLNSLVFGLSDGKVRLGNLKTNKASTLFQEDSPVVSICSSLDGNATASGHLDGSICRFFFNDEVSDASQVSPQLVCFWTFSLYLPSYADVIDIQILLLIGKVLSASNHSSCIGLE